MKRKIFFIISLLAISASSAASTYASTENGIYGNDKYSVFVPGAFTIDSETVDDYTSIYNDDITIGISALDNDGNEDASRYTEQQIAEVANDTLDSLKAQSDADIKITKHEIVAFSNNGYPSVHIAYEGTDENDEPVYMEEYILTTVNYKYTVVLYADSAEDAGGDDVKSVIDSFTVLDDPITHAEDAGNGTALALLIVSGAAVLAAFAVTLFIIVKRKKR